MNTADTLDACGAQLAQRHWDYYIWPRIESLARDIVLDLSGDADGAIPEQLAATSGRLIVADADAERLAASRASLAAAENIDYLLIDGTSLAPLDDASVTLVLSWNRLVSADPDVVEQTVAESARVLRPGGYAFFHHSNRMNDAMQEPGDEPGGRHYMSQPVLRFFARRYGLMTFDQTAIDWDESAAPARRWQKRSELLPALDAISLLLKPSDV